MNQRTIFSVLLLFLSSTAACQNDGPGQPDGPADLYSAVNPFIGTGGLGFGVGSAYPGPALPFAMIHPGPDTRAPWGAPGFNHCSGYHWDDPFIAGFSLFRMHGTGLPDYGVIAVMPVDGMSAERTDELGYQAPFSHDDEAAEPGYYRVALDSGIEVEITSTERAAAFRFHFPQGTDPVLLVDLEHTIGEGTSGGGEVSVDAAAATLSAFMHNNGDLSGRFGGFDVSAAFATDPAPSEVGVWDDAGLHPDTPAATGTDLGAWLRFPAGTEVVELRVGVSFVDEDGARQNLEAEIPGFDFDGVREAARTRWQEELGKIELEGASAADVEIVATAAYHSLLMPTLMSDADGRARSVQEEVIQVEGRRYSDFSLWDTYRTLHPWLLFSEDPRNPDFARSLIALADEGGALPRWSLAHGDAKSMLGDPAVIVMAEMAAKGIDFDQAGAYEHAMRTAYGPSLGPVGGRSGIEDYVAHGFVPADLHGGSVSRTLEFASADFALAAWARALGHDADAELLETRAAAAWRAIYDPDVGYFRGKNSDGTWVPWSGPLSEEDTYVEGNAGHYLWMVPHELDGLAEILGGEATALSRLGEYFDNSRMEEPGLGPRIYYWHGNEPDLLAPWLFAAWGRPDLSVEWIEWVVRSVYGTGADGLAGNDDGGTLSSWLLFAAAGLYPEPGTDRYLLAAPRQSRMVLHRPSGDLIIEAEPDPLEHMTPALVTLDGQPLDSPWIRHSQLQGNHVLRFAME